MPRPLLTKNHTPHTSSSPTLKKKVDRSFFCICPTVPLSFHFCLLSPRDAKTILLYEETQIYLLSYSLALTRSLAHSLTHSLHSLLSHDDDDLTLSQSICVFCKQRKTFMTAETSDIFLCVFLSLSLSFFFSSFPFF